MPTPASPFANQPWSHEWEYDVLSRFGDPDEGPDYGVVVSIKATSAQEAEQRAITYLIHNFDDTDRYQVVATSQGVLDAFAGTYRVRLDFPPAR